MTILRGHYGRIPQIIRNAAIFIGNAGLDFVFPPLCVICDNVIYSGYRMLCDECRQTMPKLNKPLLFATELTHPPDPPLWFEQTLALFEYNPQVQKLIHLYKYRNMPGFSGYLGELLGRIFLQQPELKNVDMILPVPLHISRYRERGYNQSALLALSVSKITGVPVYNKVLKRIKYTPPQASLNREERVKNLLGAFTVNKSISIRGKFVAIVDDVVTTGSTVNECARVLRAAGAGKVIVISVTRIE